MMTNYESTPNLKSVTLKSTDLNRKLFISSNSVKLFETFLKGIIGKEIVIITTNVSIEIYYASPKNYSSFIKKTLVPYLLQGINKTKLVCSHSENSATVAKNFKKTLFTFSKYPQFFLAYTKKFVHQLARNSSSKIVMPTLNKLYKNSLYKLIKSHSLPNKNKVLKIYENVLVTNQQKILHKELINKILSKNHIN